MTFPFLAYLTCSLYPQMNLLMFSISFGGDVSFDNQFGSDGGDDDPANDGK